MNAMVEATPITPGSVVPMVPQPMSPMELVAFAVQQGKDLVMIEKLMDLQDRHEAKLARKAYVAAMADFKKNPPEIVKDKHVRYTKKDGSVTEYDHATLGGLCAAVIEGLAKVGISHSWDVAQNQNQIKVTCKLTHELGHSENVSMISGPDDSGGKNAIQAIASATNYLQRYTLFAACGLAAIDDDDGRGTTPPECISKEQLETLDRELKAINATSDERAGFLRYLEVETLDQLPASEFQRAMQSIKDKARAKRKQQGAAQ